MRGVLHAQDLHKCVSIVTLKDQLSSVTLSHRNTNGGELFTPCLCKEYWEKAQEIVRVEHVDVREGGQAIIGDVTHHGGGRA